MKTYAEKLKDPRWQKKRLEVFERDNFTCQICNSKDETLNVHHKKYSKSGNPWDIYSKFLITYCEDCHKIVEDSKVEINNIFQDVGYFHQTGNYEKIRTLIEGVSLNQELIPNLIEVLKSYSISKLNGWEQGYEDGKRETLEHVTHG